MYEHFEHTADLGLRVRAPDVNSLFAEAGKALFAAIVDVIDTVRPEYPVEVHIEGSDVEYLLFDWLRELLYRFDADRMVFSQFDVSVEGGGLAATAWGEPFDRSRHLLNHEVKAITSHGLMVAEEGAEWVAEVIVDI